MDWGTVFSVVPVFLTNKIAKHKSVDSLFAELMDGDQTGESVVSQMTHQQLLEMIQCSTVDERLSKMRLSTRLLLAGTIKNGSHHSPCTAQDILPPQNHHALDDTNSYRNGLLGLRLPREDEQSMSKTGKKTGLTKSFEVMMDAICYLPYVDHVSDCFIFENLQDGIIFGEKLLGPLLPVPRFAWRELASDDAQANMAYYGVGQLYLRTSDDPGIGEHMIDMRAMARLKVRGPFEIYGAAAYFSAEKITGIFWCAGDRLVRPGDPDWEHAKFAWRASLFTWVTAIDHLLVSHFIFSNGINAALREALPCDHPVRRVLHVNTFGASKVNASAAYTLAPEGALFQRMSALQWDGGLKDAFELGVAGYKFETWPQRVQNSDLPPHVKARLPLFVDGLDVWNALHDFYQRYVDLYYRDTAAVCADSALRAYWEFRSTRLYTQGLPALSKPALVDQLTHACFGVTAFHQIAGDVVQYVTTPEGMSFQIRPGQVMADAEEFTCVMALTASTGRMMPLLTQDWSHLLERTDACMAAWQSLRESLQRVSARVEARNRARRIPFTEMDPIKFECSVSV